jgi:hypothetical protein
MPYGRTLFLNQLNGAVENKGLMPTSGKNFIVREHILLLKDNKAPYWGPTICSMLTAASRLWASERNLKF